MSERVLPEGAVRLYETASGTIVRVSTDATGHGRLIALPAAKMEALLDERDRVQHYGDNARRDLNAAHAEVAALRDELARLRGAMNDLLAGAQPYTGVTGALIVFPAHIAEARAALEPTR